MAILETMDGVRHDLIKYGVPVLKVAPIDIVYNSENIKGRPGRNRTERYHGVRKLQLTLLLQAKNVTDTELLTDQLADILDGDEEFYIYQQLMTGSYKFELPGDSSFVRALDNVEWTPHMYKRWKVERINNDAIEWNGLRGKRVIEFETSDLPYGETPFTSLQLLGKEWDLDQIAWGLGFEWDDDSPQFTFNTNTFTVKNYGQVTINPRYMSLRIVLRGNFPSGLTISNQTTGDTFTYNGSLTTNDTMIIDGVSYLKNGIHVIGQTNKKLISLKRGVNQFVISGGGTVASISFDFPFYFK